MAKHIKEQMREHILRRAWITNQWHILQWGIDSCASAISKFTIYCTNVTPEASVEENEIITNLQEAAISKRMLMGKLMLEYRSLGEAINTLENILLAVSTATPPSTPERGDTEDAVLTGLIHGTLPFDNLSP